MSNKIINIVDPAGKLVASISPDDVILKDGYKAMESYGNSVCLKDDDGELEVIRPEVSI
ncbi:hypothetical protein [Virgibacillus chiguensis]|uniref:Uncharacterized protein n=1 Tax=Virgibacillus chiguensis TaxID=411959 RepID=A0A1M5XQ04_9BACI|nr:hypothetical protein [Virgibacillus chiguensis]SHI01925.1 hypothetical protein SAMN05421807_13214 [Virgibacillus chiguensis]